MSLRCHHFLPVPKVLVKLLVLVSPQVKMSVLPQVKMLVSPEVKMLVLALV